MYTHLHEHAHILQTTHTKTYQLESLSLSVPDRQVASCPGGYSGAQGPRLCDLCFLRSQHFHFSRKGVGTEAQSTEESLLLQMHLGVGERV